MDRLLIANRGEIAVRIAKTARRLGIETVGVYSAVDANAMHVDAMDLAVALGGDHPADSYLRADAIVAAAMRTGCDAVHPGYGFLAENADFAGAVVAAGLVWVGPPAAQIALLGDKVAAKRQAVEAGLATGAGAVVDADSDLSRVPLPALIKAAFGGGGRGMRIVRDRSDLAEAVLSAGREAKAAFGDGTVFIEPFVERARHIEVQIVGDAHGNVVHLGERECSIQRRNQKVIEEAPSIGIDAATREVLFAGAIALGRHIGYENAGTVEFLVGDDGSVTFLEVNTRIQVEHPVTEAITGIDIVELQLNVADGHPLPFTQEQITFTGHAIEARLVAESPADDWMPSTGTLRRFSIPGTVRTDSGVGAGTEVTSFYDSMLAKVIAHAPTRTAAARLLANALSRADIDGVRTNVETCVAILREQDFLAGSTFTSYLAEHAGLGSTPSIDAAHRTRLLVAAALAAEARDRAADARWGFAPSGWRNVRTQGQRQSWRQVGSDEDTSIELTIEGRRVRALVGDVEVSATLLHRESDAGDHSCTALEIDGIRHVFTTDVDGRQVFAASRLGAARFVLVDRLAVPDGDLVGDDPRSPLPGTVIAVVVAVDDVVEVGDRLVVVEAMKMEHTISANRQGTVREVRVAVGDRVDAGEILVVIEA